MAIVTIDDTNLTNIAGAIREKNGTETTYKPSEMAAAISAIQAGGGELNIVEVALTGKGSSTGMTPFNVYDYVESTEDIACIFIKLAQDKTNYMTGFCYIKGYCFCNQNISNVDYFTTADMLGVITNPYRFDYIDAATFPTKSSDTACALGISTDGKINTFSWTGSKWTNASNTATGSGLMHIWMLYK